MTRAILTIMSAMTGELNMFTDKATALRRHRAVTLIEAVLYISIALALIVGGLVFFQQASTAAKTSRMIRQLSASIAEGRVVMTGLSFTADHIDLTPIFVAAGAVPQEMLAGETTLPNPFSPTLLSNPFGGWTMFFGGIYGSSRMLEVLTTNVPQGVCARLLTATGGVEVLSGAGGSMTAPAATNATTLVSSGFHAAGVGSFTDYSIGTGNRHYVMNPTQAGWMCKYGGVKYSNKTTEPTSTPLSGNVYIRMQFLIDR